MAPAADGPHRHVIGGPRFPRRCPAALGVRPRRRCLDLAALVGASFAIGFTIVAGVDPDGLEYEKIWPSRPETSHASLDNEAGVPRFRVRCPGELLSSTAA